MFDDDETLLLLVASVIAIGSGWVLYAWTESLRASLVGSFVCFWVGLVLAIVIPQNLPNRHDAYNVLLPDRHKRLNEVHAVIDTIIRDYVETRLHPDDDWEGDLAMHYNGEQVGAPILVRYGDSTNHPLPTAITAHAHMLLRGAGPTTTAVRRWVWQRTLRDFNSWYTHAPRYNAHARIAAHARMQRVPQSYVPNSHIRHPL